MSANPSLDDLLRQGFGDSVPEAGTFAKINEQRVVHSTGFVTFLRIFHADGGELTYRDRHLTVRCEAAVWDRGASTCWDETEEISDTGETSTQITNLEKGRIHAALAVLDLEVEPY